MLTFLKYLIQLTLSPSEGWKDIEKEDPQPKALLYGGLYPLLALTSLSELLAVVYERSISLSEALIAAVDVAGAYFITLYLAKLVFELYLPRILAAEPDLRRIAVFIICSVGLLLLFLFIDNCLPWSLVPLKFLPIYVALVISKAHHYLNVKRREEMHFTVLAACVLVLVPTAIYYLVYLLVI